MPEGHSTRTRLALTLPTYEVDTRWTTGVPQHGNEWFDVTFDRDLDVARLVFHTDRTGHADRPRQRTRRVADRDADTNVTQIESEDAPAAFHVPARSACTRAGIVAIAWGTWSALVPPALASDSCTGCNICAVVCPEAAITVYRQALRARAAVEG